MPQGQQNRTTETFIDAQTARANVFMGDTNVRQELENISRAIKKAVEQNLLETTVPYLNLATAAATWNTYRASITIPPAEEKNWGIVQKMEFTPDQRLDIQHAGAVIEHFRKLGYLIEPLGTGWRLCWADFLQDQFSLNGDGSMTIGHQPQREGEENLGGGKISFFGQPPSYQPFFDNPTLLNVDTTDLATTAQGMATLVGELQRIASILGVGSGVGLIEGGYELGAYVEGDLQAIVDAAAAAAVAAHVGSEH